jgi:hypothetical protein
MDQQSIITHNKGNDEMIQEAFLPSIFFPKSHVNLHE